MLKAGRTKFEIAGVILRLNQIAQKTLKTTIQP